MSMRIITMSMTSTAPAAATIMTMSTTMITSIITIMNIIMSMMSTAPAAATITIMSIITITNIITIMNIIMSMMSTASAAAMIMTIMITTMATTMPMRSSPPGAWRRSRRSARRSLQIS